MFEEQLCSAEDEEFLMREEEEDILDAFMGWAREKWVACSARQRGTFDSPSEYLERMEGLMSTAFAKQVL